LKKAYLPWVEENQHCEGGFSAQRARVKEQAVNLVQTINDIGNSLAEYTPELSTLEAIVLQINMW